MRTIDRRLHELEKTKAQKTLVFIKSLIGDGPTRIVFIGGGREWLRTEYETADTFRDRAAKDVQQASEAPFICLREFNQRGTAA